MADDTKLRFSRSPYAHGAAAERIERAPSSDPLAELARLIGQDDAFDRMGRDSARIEARAQPESSEERVRSSYSAAAREPDGERPETHTDFAARIYGDDPPAHAAYPEPYYADGPADPQAGAVPESAYEDGYDEPTEPPPVERRRGGLITIAAVLGLAVVGTAAAFGYRAFTSGTDSAQPPVIAADKAPAKIVPAPPSNESQTSRGFDRGDKPQPEKVVPREEQPIEMREAKAPTPKMMVPNAGGATGIGAPAQGAAPLAAPAAMAPIATNPNEPKKVRTLAIRPDGSVAPESAANRPQDLGATRGIAPTQTTPARPTPPGRPGASAQPGAPGPLALNSQGEAARPPANIPTQTASIRPTENPTPPKATMPIAAGSHVVQLASQKSEAEAQASFRSLQAKYPTVLAGRQPLIRKVELGERGTYYRAQVGPFGSVEQANEMCSNLKAAGGQCIVQRN